MLDLFTDQNFTNTPAWSGTTNRWETASNAAGGPAASGARILRNDPGNGTASNYLSTPINTWHTNQEWIFWYGRIGNALSANSTVRFWLYANNSDLTSNSNSGYAISMGDGTGTQEIRLQKIENGAVTNTIITSTGGIPANLNDYGIAIRVVRNELGQWELFTSAYPTTNGTGIGANSNMLTAASTSRGTGTDNTIALDGTGYIGPVVRTTNNTTNSEFDGIYFTACNPKTEVSLTSSSIAADETDGTITITASITNPHPNTATTASLALTSGDASLINNYTTQTITFPAGSSESVIITVTLTDDEFCSGTNNQLVFSLQNVSGGYIATAGSTASTTLLLQDDESLFANMFDEDFESGDASDWFTPVAGSFVASSTNPINGSYSLRHVDQGETSGGAASFSADIANASLSGSNTTWRFNVNTFGVEPNTSTYWIVCITNDQADIANQTIDGYAVGIIPSFFTGTDFLTLYRTEDDYLYPMVVSPIDIGADYTKLGIEVTRNELGFWELKVDTNGDFDNLISQGTAFDATTNELDNFGAYYVYNTSTKSLFSIDDISITQQACEQTLYSQMSGASNAAVWAQVPVGTPAVGAPGPFTRLVIQDGHNITFSGNTLCRTLEIENGATVTGNNSTINLRGNFLNNGTFTGGTSSIHFSGTGAQTISGTGTTTFHDVIVNNNGGVALNQPANIKGQLRAQNGTFNTNNQLTLISNITETGSIGTISSTADVIGQITMQRFIPLAPQYWVYMANPLLNQTIQDLNDDLVITGFPGSDYPNYNFNSFYHYDEVQPGGRNVGWVGATNVTNALDPKRGYIVYMNATAVTMDMSGDFQKGNVSVPLVHTDNEPGTGYFNPDGWNLVANVYPCAIDWVALRDASTSWSSGNGSYYVYDAAGSNYRVYNGASQAGTANRYIASGQGFFVQAVANMQSLEFNENVKATSSAAFQRNADDATIVRFNFTRGNMDDEMVLTLRDDATLGFDELYDGIKWESPVANAPEIAFLAPDESKLTLQAIGQITEDIEIPVFVKMPQTGNYTFSVSQVLNLPLGVCLTVQDLVTGEIIPLEEGQTLTINNTAAYTGNRLMIRMTAPIEANVVNASCFGANDGSIVLNSAISSWTVLAQDAFGNTYYPENGAISNLAAGDYNVMLENADALCFADNIGLTVSEPEAISSSVSHTIDRCNNSTNAAIEIVLSQNEIFNYTVTNASGEIVAEESLADNYKLLEGLSAGVYSVQVSTDCYNETFNVDLNDPFAIALDLSISTPTLDMVVGQTVYIQAQAMASNAIEYEWSVNGFDGGDQPVLNFAVNTAGVYNIQCTANTEGCSATAFTSAVVNEVEAEEEEEEEVLSTEELAEGSPYATVVRMGNSVVVNFMNTTNEMAKIKLYNATGKLVMQVNANVSARQVRTIDITGLASGMYVVHVEQENQNLAKQQFIK